ncbi:serine dehydratase subunit alpha family protein [Alloiococcus sp. CFN-8]|uniref:L-cysteine desulfidase family protein n=1 Tax=Alloiococcus sp. CFN-8 TaxID=3416081 RepID=UPI003CF7E153
MDVDKLYIGLLKEEVKPALGCTEPVAIAYATAKASELLGEIPENIHLLLSVNIIKNALGVGIPGTDTTGAAMASALGAVCRNSHLGLGLLSEITEDRYQEAKKILEENRISLGINNGDEKLYIEVICSCINKNTRVVIQGDHTNIILMERNGETIYSKERTNPELDNKYDEMGKNERREAFLSINAIYSFIKNIPFQEISFLLEGINMNKRVSQEGLSNQWGLMVGEKIYNSIEFNPLQNSLANKIVAETAAASDARMAGCSLPIMTTAGSGNQGITCTLPPAVLARELNKSDEELIRAVALSNLVTIYIKEFMGRLSPICGAGIAASTGAAAGMTYLLKDELDSIKCAINNMLADVAGIICDGAKSSCALKIATSVNAAIQCSMLAVKGIQPGGLEGIINDDVDKTIRNIGDLVQKGYENTDRAILEIMLNK